jgi:hypothetical protein
MSEHNLKTVTRKVTITLPVEVLEKLDKQIGARHRSDFIVDAILAKLTLEDQVEALDEAAGAWKAEDYPDLVTDADIDSWLHSLRSSWSQMES